MIVPILSRAWSVSHPRETRLFRPKRSAADKRGAVMVFDGAYLHPKYQDGDNLPLGISPRRQLKSTAGGSDLGLDAF